MRKPSRLAQVFEGLPVVRVFWRMDELAAALMGDADQTKAALAPGEPELGRPNVLRAWLPDTSPRCRLA